ncbi:MAG: mandelate racemase, partial [Candidatus Latescibacterota bacterium]
MRILDIRQRTVSISRYADTITSPAGLDTSIGAVVTDVERNGKQVVGFGFSSFGRFAQAGLLGDRFVPRLMAAGEDEIATESGENVDPL